MANDLSGVCQSPDLASCFRILIVEDHALVREYVLALLNQQAGLIPIGAVASIAEGVEAVGCLRPDIVLLDLSLPDGNGLDAVQVIRTHWPETRVLIHSAEASSNILDKALAVGVQGYVVKGGTGVLLLSAIRQIAVGEIFVDPWFTTRYSEGN